MFNRIIVALKFTSASKYALEKGIGLAKDYGADLHIFHALDYNLKKFDEGNPTLIEKTNEAEQRFEVEMKPLFGDLTTFTFGCEPAAHALIQKLQSGIQKQKKRLQGVPKKITLLLLNEGGDPNGALYAVGRSTFLGELLELAGGENILTDPTLNYPKISKEFILRHSPEVIIQAGPRANMSPQEKAEKLKQWQRFPTLTAVKNETIYFVGADYILIPGPRFLNTLNHFTRVIHPEAFRD